MKQTILYAILLVPVLLCSPVGHAANTEFQDINTLFKQGQYAQALERDNAWINKNPKDAQARFLKGLILTEQNKPNEAIAVFTGLTEDFPELPEPYNNLAVLYAAQGNYDKARYALEMAIHTHPSYAVAHENLGDVYAKMASLAYDKALQLDTANASVHTKLSLIKEIFTPGATTRTGCGELASTAPVRKPAPPTANQTSNTANPATNQNDGAAKPTANQNLGASNPAATKNSDILDAVHAWAQAWSDQKPEAYLAAYAADFAPPGGQTHAQWESVRRERITAPKQISVKLSAIQVTTKDANHASVSFTQNYRSDRLSSTSHKVLELSRDSNGKWLINQESSR